VCRTERAGFVLCRINHSRHQVKGSSVRLVVLVSGGGTTLQNLLDQTQSGALAASVVGVVASRPGIKAIDRATRAGIPVVVVPRAPQADVNERTSQAIAAFQPDVVCLAGWLHLLTIPRAFEGRVLNIHPSLLPAFGGVGMYGRHVHASVLASGATESGCTVHFADAHYDTGRILVQARVPVLPTDTPESLAERVHLAECVAYPAALRLVAALR
jgi:phosphoribosylglycinamide formyltransferase 1